MACWPGSDGASFILDVLGPVTLLAAGLTVTVTPLTATVLGAVEEERAGLASGVNNAVARTGGLLLVAVLPALTGLGADGFADPAALAPAFTSAMLICAGLLALGGVVSALTLRPTATPAGVGEERTAASHARRHQAPSGDHRHTVTDRQPHPSEDRSTP